MSGPPDQIALAGRSYLVGGASRGLGLAVATELVRGGAQTLLIARDGQRLRAASESLGSNARPLRDDLTDPRAPGRLLAAARERFPDGIDGVLLNAGGPARGGVLDLDDATWHAAWELLIATPIRLVRTLEPHMRAGSSILLVTSSSVREPVPGLDASNVLRPAAAALARRLAAALAPRIRVNSIAPGRFDTDRAREGDERRAATAGITTEQAREQSAQSIPLRRYGDPAELAQAAAFLLSPAASYITGATLHVDGGLVSSAP